MIVNNLNYQTQKLFISVCFCFILKIYKVKATYIAKLLCKNKFSQEHNTIKLTHLKNSEK